MNQNLFNQKNEQILMKVELMLKVNKINLKVILYFELIILQLINNVWVILMPKEIYIKVN